MFQVKVNELGVVQVCHDGHPITVQRYNVCGELAACEEAVTNAARALEYALLEVVRQSWRHHHRARVLEATNGLHA